MDLNLAESGQNIRENGCDYYSENAESWQLSGRTLPPILSFSNMLRENELENTNQISCQSQIQYQYSIPNCGYQPHWNGEPYHAPDEQMIELVPVVDDGVLHQMIQMERTQVNKSKRSKERRTASINSAYNILRSHIPNVPAETKLSKIKTLRYAASYIKYLMDILKNDDAEPAEFSPSD
ncbi:Oidioi.mRNA.OKI2018_I69.XSR.g16423.t1.cds [Oikopleura dioica]|uniref:Oidioi.mRNA.OKI2018_I69.XSR.g16423.t1.cds n=1 Tax=Oikopleura dioica TaxID=34765 RepID=A0ABN7SG27_OIKDI|nr:Oidioi.mRNA.OKI2018_I69.XSR.g16423.t1.cds [Oikopleura dioica]